MHLGPVASGMERNGDGSDLGDRNRAAKARNAERERIEGDRTAVSAEIIDLAAERQRRERNANCARRSGRTARRRSSRSLTEKRSTFSRGDLNRELAKVIPDPQERAGADRSDSGAAGRRRARGERSCPGVPLHDAGGADGRRPGHRGRRGPCRRTRHGLTTVQGEATLDRHPQVTGERRTAFWHIDRGPRDRDPRRRVGRRQEHDLTAVRDAYEGRLPGHRHGLDQPGRAEPATRRL